MNNSIVHKRAQVPAPTLVVGIDPHKRQHQVSVQGPEGGTLASFTIDHTQAGFEMLLRRCQTLAARHGQAPLLFAIEAGGHHWRLLAAYLSAHGQTYRLINPLTLQRQRDGEDLQRRKSDDRDASMAAQLAREGKYTWSQWAEGPYAELRLAYDLYTQLVQQISQLKLRLTTALEQLFPEFQGVFRRLEGATALTVLRHCPNPHVLARLSAEAIETALRRRHGGQRFMAAKVRQLHQQARQTIGLRAGSRALSRQVRRWAEQLQLLLTHRQAAVTELAWLLSQRWEEPILRSITGLGVIHAAGLLAHIGPIACFSRPNQLPKLAGVVPSQARSAQWVAQHTPMSKHGRPALRAVAHQAVVSLLRHNSVFQTYVQRLTHRDHEPLTKREAMGAAANKLLRLIYILLTRRERFDPQRAQAA